MRLRTVFVSVATVGLMVGPAFANGILNSAAGAAKECTITGSAANDAINGTTRADVICLKAGEDVANGNEGNDVIKGGQGDDYNDQNPDLTGVPMGAPPAFDGLRGNDGSDTVKGQGDDDDVSGDGQNDKLYGGQGDDYIGAATGETTEPGNDFLKSKDGVSGNDYIDGGDNTDTCVIDAGDNVSNCEL
ncbi:MAG: calcium-binding protein [Actinomycetota bacterium]